MNIDLIPILLCIAAFAVIDYLRSTGKRPSTTRMIRKLIERAAWEGLLGPPRIRKDYGRLYVVGYGQRHPIRTRAQGQRLAARMKEQIEDALKTLPSAGSAAAGFSRRASTGTTSSA